MGNLEPQDIPKTESSVSELWRGRVEPRNTRSLDSRMELVWTESDTKQHSKQRSVAKEARLKEEPPGSGGVNRVKSEDDDLEIVYENVKTLGLRTMEKVAPLGEPKPNERLSTLWDADFAADLLGASNRLRWNHSIVATPQSPAVIVQECDERPLDSSNVGFRLLREMGWRVGQGIGRDNQGRVNPIETRMRVNRLGLGAPSPDKVMSVVKKDVALLKASVLRPVTARTGAEIPPPMKVRNKKNVHKYFKEAKRKFALKRRLRVDQKRRVLLPTPKLNISKQRNGRGFGSSLIFQQVIHMNQVAVTNESESMQWMRGHREERLERTSRPQTGTFPEKIKHERLGRRSTGELLSWTAPNFYKAHPKTTIEQYTGYDQQAAYCVGGVQTVVEPRVRRQSSSHGLPDFFYGESWR